MNITIYPRNLNGTVVCPSSKSLTHRAVICAALAKGESKIYNPLYCDDTLYTIKALELIGVKFIKSKNYLIVKPPKYYSIPPKFIECGNSGSSLRLLAPLFCTLFKGVTFHGDERLLDRIEQTDLNDLNIHYHRSVQTINIFEFNIKAQMTLSDEKTTQYISGLLLASVLYNHDFSLKVYSKHSTLNPYIILTLDILNKFGITWTLDTTIDQHFIINIKSGQKYQATNIKIEGDYSAGANLLIMGALGEKVIVKNLFKNSLQGDAIIIDFLKKMGTRIEVGQDTITVKNSNLKGGNFDISTCPDLGPLLMGVLSISYGQSTISGIEKLIYKESNRLFDTINCLQSIGADILYQNNVIIINGKELLNGGKVVNSYFDHRIVLMLATISSRLASRITVLNGECVSKSYPNFWNDFRNLSGSIVEEHYE